MKVTLIHNPGAGLEEHSSAALAALFEQAGHDVHCQSSKKTSFCDALDDPADVVVVAGGDGTVRKTALALIGSGTPISILPMGTANNVARMLGLMDSPERLIAGLESATPQRFDVAVATGAWGPQLFIESFGTGLVADYMQIARYVGEAPDRFARDLTLFQDTLSKISTRRWKITADEKEVSGEFLFVEALNIRSIGPALMLAPGAQCDDGCLDLIAITEGDRPALSRYIAARLAGGDATLLWPSIRFQNLTIEGDAARSHFDDQLQEPSELGRLAVHITVEPGALEFLVPQTAPRPGKS
jgi:diacylglycerol kinase (ATP)